MSKLFVMVGLPASGKSTYTKDLAMRENAEIFSSDVYRAKFGYGEEDQTVNSKIFQYLHNDIKTALRNGKNCIYDATNLISKRRRTFLQEIKNIPCEKICVLIARPLKDCLRSNYERERTVPVHAMLRMYRGFETPYFEEGWDDIVVILDEHDCDKSIDTFIDKVMNFDQNNSHHSNTLGRHLINVGEYISNPRLNCPSELVAAAYLHDCGKIYTKTFLNSKGEFSNEAHYYNHENVGAYEVFFFKNVKNKLLVSWLINNHMRPYTWKTPDTAEKYRQLWGDNKFSAIMLLHEADVNSH